MIVLSEEQKTELKRALGLGYTTIFGVGLILGAGVYALIIPAEQYAENALWLSVLFATLIAVLTAFSYAEFASMFPLAASTHTYIERTFPKYKSLAFVSGWLIAFEGIAGAATASVGFSWYLVGLLGLDVLWIPIIAILLILVLTFFNWLGIEESTKLILVFTFIEAFGLILVAALGFFHPNVANPNPNYFEISGDGGILAILLGAAVFYFAFTGFELQPTLAEEVKEPKKTVPKAIILALLICSFLYLLVALAVVRLLPPEVLAETEGTVTLADAVKNISFTAYYLLSFIALFSTSNTVLGFLVSGSRLIYGLAEEGYLPKKLAKVDPKRRTPIIAILTATAISILVIATTLYIPYLLGWEETQLGRGKKSLLNLVGKTASLSALLVFVLINMAVILYRIWHPEVERKFKIPHLSLPLIGAILTAIFIAVSFSEWIVWLNTFIVAMLGAVLYYFEFRVAK